MEEGEEKRTAAPAGHTVRIPRDALRVRQARHRSRVHLRAVDTRDTNRVIAQGTVGRKETSRKMVNQAALFGAGLGLLPFRFAAPAVAALGLKLLKDVREAYEAEPTPVEQAAAAAVLGASEFALGQATRAVRIVPWAGPVLSAALTGGAVKALGEGAIAYYQWSRHVSEAEARPASSSEDIHTRVTI